MEIKSRNIYYKIFLTRHGYLPWEQIHKYLQGIFDKIKKDQIFSFVKTNMIFKVLLVCSCLCMTAVSPYESIERLQTL